jgi:hypothetical protein
MSNLDSNLWFLNGCLTRAQSTVYFGYLRKCPRTGPGGRLPPFEA